MNPNLKKVMQREVRRIICDGCAADLPHTMIADEVIQAVNQAIAVEQYAQAEKALETRCQPCSRPAEMRKADANAAGGAAIQDGK